MNFILGMIQRRTISYHVITSDTIATRLLCQHSGFLKLKRRKNNLKAVFSISLALFYIVIGQTESGLGFKLLVDISSLSDMLGLELLNELIDLDQI